MDIFNPSPPFISFFLAGIMIVILRLTVIAKGLFWSVYIQDPAMIDCNVDTTTYKVDMFTLALRSAPLNVVKRSN